MKRLALLTLALTLATGCATMAALQPRLVGPRFRTDPEYGKCVLVGVESGTTTAQLTIHVCGRIGDGALSALHPSADGGTGDAAGDGQ